MSEHTPGPWQWTIHDVSMATLGKGESPSIDDVMSVGPCKSCYTRAEDEWKWGRCNTPSRADARLIAAAPELLEALKRILYAPDDELAKANDQARSAIAKAEGKP